MKWVWQAVLGFIAGTVAIVTFQAVASSDADTPQACIEALDAGDETIDIASDALRIAAEGFGAVSELNLAALEDAGRRIDDLAPAAEEAAGNYDRLSKECRG